MKMTSMIGEATKYDKKQAVERKKVKSWLKSISAFANTEGGVLVFGVDDNDEIIGLQDAKADSEFISQKIKERISSFPNVNLRFEQSEDGKTILFVEVPQGKETPYYYIGDNTTEAYIRIGNESVLAGATELKRLVMRGQNVTYDSVMSQYKFEDYSFSKLRERYKSWTGKSLEEKVFESFNIKTGEGYLTNAGALLADDSPIWWSRLFCTRWNGLTKSSGRIDAFDSGEYSGSLIVLLDDGMRFVMRNMKKMWRKTATSRVEMPEYSKRSVFEALVNAFVHRDYMVMGSEVHVDMFDDRIVIYSPGGMADGKPIQDRDIASIPSIRRNPVLADIFDRLGLMERQGSGLGKIREGYKLMANFRPGKEPVFISSHSEFMVIFPNLNYKLSQDDTLNGALNGTLNGALNGTLNGALNDNEKNVLAYLKLHERATQEQLGKEFDISRRTVQRITKKLQDMAVLVRVGSRNNGYWMVTCDE